MGAVFNLAKINDRGQDRRLHLDSLAVVCLAQSRLHKIAGGCMMDLYGIGVGISCPPCPRLLPLAGWQNITILFVLFSGQFLLVEP